MKTCALTYTAEQVTDIFNINSGINQNSTKNNTHATNNIGRILFQFEQKY
jgi:hypothetical protein